MEEKALNYLVENAIIKEVEAFRCGSARLIRAEEFAGNAADVV